MTDTTSASAGDFVTGSSVLELYPGGYPVHIDLAQQDVGGQATAVRFNLPLRGHNLPLTHHFEHKLVIALRGVLQIHCGRYPLALLKKGAGLVLQPGTAHRIAQHGQEGSTVGVVLWPGAVERAFREIARHTKVAGLDMDGMKAILADYGVRWDGGQAARHPPVRRQPEPVLQAVAALPRAVQVAVLAHLPHWFI